MLALSALTALLALPPCPAEIQAAIPRYVDAEALPDRPRPQAACLTANGMIALPVLPFDRKGRLSDRVAALDAVAEWLHTHPDRRLVIHASYWVSWIRSAQPAGWRAKSILRYLGERGIVGERLHVDYWEHLIRAAKTPAGRPAVRALRARATREWMTVKSGKPVPIANCDAACKTLGRCRLSPRGDCQR